MNGTEKQIAFAEEIKNAAMTNVLHNAELSMQRYEEYDHHPNYLAEAEAFRIMAACLEKVFAAHDDAEYFISNREKLSFASLFQTVDRWAELIRQGKKTAAQIAFENGVKNW